MNIPTRPFQTAHIILWTLLLAFQPTVQASDITLAVSSSIPPYFIKKTNSGFQLDIIREALRINGHNIKKINYVSHKRLVALFKQGQVDAAINPPTHVSMGFSSDPIVDMENYAIALKESNFNIRGVGDLIQKRVLAFQFAHAYLGQDIKNLAITNPEYHEVQNQTAQILQLYSNRTDVILIDKRIFLYLHKKLEPQLHFQKSVEFFPIFSKSNRNAVFAVSSLRDDFNNGLAKLRDSGRYNEILMEYQSTKKPAQGG